MESPTVYQSANNLYSEPLHTYSGLRVDVFNPTPDMFCIEDIAHALSNICRFGGHTNKFYSVAEHCVRVSHLVKPEFKLQALLHDASEAYIWDMPTPIKSKLVGYEGIENGIMLCIAKKFGFSWPMADQVHEADKEMLKCEWCDLFSGNIQTNEIKPKKAKGLFLFTFCKLLNQ